MLDAASLLQLAVDAATHAGGMLLEGLHHVRATIEHKSSPTDMVTEMDRAAEAHIVAALKRARPDDGILGEEGSLETGTTGVRWIIDPLDGTTNYLYGFPAFGVSIAAEVDGTVAAAVVHDPSHRETFTAIGGQGSWLDGVPLRVAGPDSVAAALVGTGFSYQPAQRARQAQVLVRLLSHVRDIRRAGAASLDLCWVGAGRLDAFYERGLQPWDYSAGALVAAEAGASVGDLEGGPPSTEITIAAAPSIAVDFWRLLVDAESDVPIQG